jgi:hypothetical protein
MDDEAADGVQLELFELKQVRVGSNGVLYSRRRVRCTTYPTM